MVKNAGELCGTYEPITLERLSVLSGRRIEDVMEFFDEAFGGYDNYVKACRDGDALDEALQRLFEQ